MLTADEARRFAHRWYAAWNAHDLEAILDHYADDVEMTSPLVASLTGGDRTGLSGKEALRAYFASGLERYPDLRFTPIRLFVGADSLVLEYESVGGATAAEVVFLDDAGQVRRYAAHYV